MSELHHAPHPSATLEYFAVSVGDLEWQRRFYADAFGLVTVEAELEIGEAGVRSVIIAAENGLRVELIERTGSVNRGPMDAIGRAGQQGYTHVALRVKDLQGAVDAVVRAGGSVVSDPADARRPGVRYAFVGDPEGTLIELVQCT